MRIKEKEVRRPVIKKSIYSSIEYWNARKEKDKEKENSEKCRICGAVMSKTFKNICPFCGTRKDPNERL